MPERERLGYILKRRIRARHNPKVYFQQVARWFAYIVLTWQKKGGSCHLVSPRKQAGNIIYLKENFNPADYSTLWEFIQNGPVKSRVTTARQGADLSGAGYLSDLEKLTGNYLHNLLTLIVAELMEEHNPFLREWVQKSNFQHGFGETVPYRVENAGRIAAEILYSNLVGNFLRQTFTDELKAGVIHIPCQTLFQYGNKAAQKKLQAERLRRMEFVERQRLGVAADRKKAAVLWRRVWGKVEKQEGEIGRKRLQKQMIDQHIYEEKLKHIFEELCREGTTRTEIKILALFPQCNFSSFVTEVLTNFPGD
ncbi:MAG: hypothetical protein GX334_06170 [Firmicutes bacterium]|nr:hypothetical protein [Bacillota bacterium]